MRPANCNDSILGGVGDELAMQCEQQSNRKDRLEVGTNYYLPAYAL
jgi:hypothetical protein